MVRWVCAVRIFADVDKGDHQGHPGPDGRPRVGMPHDAGYMGREVDKSVCHGFDHTDTRYHRTSMVARVAVRARMEQSEYTVYRTGYCDTAVRRAGIAMERKDTERLQNMPATR